MTKQEWENCFNNWRQPLSATEETKCGNAERMVKEALKASSDLSKWSLEVFLQGSYRNNTNVKTESDIDICVKFNESFFYTLPDGYVKESFGISDALPPKPTYKEYRQQVVNALNDKFGSQNVVPGNKAIVVTENTYRIHADVVACFEHRRYDASGNYVSGIEFTTTSGTQVTNFPVQHIESGTKKNNDSGHQYKRVARILKTINVESDGKNGYKKLPSFFIECLAWNIPNNILSLFRVCSRGGFCVAKAR